MNFYYVLIRVNLKKSAGRFFYCHLILAENHVKLTRYSFNREYRKV